MDGLYGKEGILVFENFKKSNNDIGNEVSENNKSDFPDFFNNQEQNYYALDTESVTYSENVDRQNQELDAVESGKKFFDRDNSHEVGNYGEMKTDQDLRAKGYERISNEMVTDIDEQGHQGLDGVYYNPEGHPQYLIVDAKYGSAKLNPNTADGKQMCGNWIDNRLDKDLGKDKADEIRLEKLFNPDNVGAYVAHVDETGNISYDKLDGNANIIEKGVNL